MTSQKPCTGILAKQKPSSGSGTQHLLSTDIPKVLKKNPWYLGMSFSVLIGLACNKGVRVFLSSWMILIYSHVWEPVPLYTDKIGGNDEGAFTIFCLVFAIIYFFR